MNSITILYDGRGEKDPYLFSASGLKEKAKKRGLEYRVEQRQLVTGDYSIAGLEHIVAIERKKLDDFVNRLSAGKPTAVKGALSNKAGYPARTKRDKFFSNQVEPLSKTMFRAIVIESNFYNITNKSYFSNMHPNAIKGNITTIIAMYSIPVLFSSDRAGGEDLTFDLLIKWYERFNSTFSV
jgi:ERCC4-type nuclease